MDTGKVSTGEILVRKIEGESNIVDALTKHVETQRNFKHKEWVNCEVREGRHLTMPEFDLGIMVVIDMHLWLAQRSGALQN